MKGKVGEAMTSGLPVVTTGFGAEGFGLTKGEHLLIANAPASFAQAVSSLITDRELRFRLGSAGRAFIEAHYSPAAISRELIVLTTRLADISPRRMPFAGPRRFSRKAALWVDRTFLWRIRSGASHRK